MSANSAVASPTPSRNRGVPQTEKSITEFLAETREQPKFLVSLPKNIPGSPNEGDKRIQINGAIWQIKRGHPVNVPQSVYEVLVACGEISALRPEDMDLAPEISHLPVDVGGYLHEQAARAAGVSNWS